MYNYYTLYKKYTISFQQYFVNMYNNMTGIEFKRIVPSLTYIADKAKISRNELYYYFNMKMIPQSWIDKLNQSKAIKITKAKFLNKYATNTKR